MSLSDQFKEMQKAATGVCSATDVNCKAIDTYLKAQDALNIAETNNQQRLLTLNSFYGKKYASQNQIMKVFVIMCLIVGGLWVAGLYLPIIPQSLLTLLVSLTIAICLTIMFYKAYDIVSRNNIDYELYEYNMNNLPSVAPKTKNAGSIGTTSAESTYKFGKHCSDDTCCPKFYTFNAGLGYCSLNPF